MSLTELEIGDKDFCIDHANDEYILKKALAYYYQVHLQII